MPHTMKFRLIGKEKITGNDIMTGWANLNITMEKLNEYYEWFEKLAYNINIEFKTEVIDNESK